MDQSGRQHAAALASLCEYDSDSDLTDIEDSAQPVVDAAKGEGVSATSKGSTAPLNRSQSKRAATDTISKGQLPHPFYAPKNTQFHPNLPKNTHFHRFSPLLCQSHSVTNLNTNPNNSSR